jgi:anaerobic selenocysteine-containing dehydrogenase
MEGKRAGAKIITFDPRLSNTAALSDVWLPSWPGSETFILLAIANHLLQTGAWDKDFVRRWVNWEAFLDAAPGFLTDDSIRAMVDEAAARKDATGAWDFADFDAILTALYAEFTIQRAASEGRVPAEKILECAELIANCDGKLAAHTWRSATMGNKGGWQVARCLFFLNVLTGSVGNPGGTSMNSWNKFVPQPHSQPPPFTAWNELHLPLEWPFAMYEMSFLLPHFLEEGRGVIDVYFTRVYNPMWINPDGFMWLEALRDTEKMKFHVALTPTWNESAWFADYVLPMGHASERHDLQSQETHASQWIAFRQPVQRVARERMGQSVEKTWQSNPGEVWEEAEFWIDLSVRMDPDGSLGIKQWFESPNRPGETITLDEYYAWIFENSVPGLPEKAAEEGLSALAWMRKYGAFEVTRDCYTPYEEEPVAEGCSAGPDGLLRDGAGKAVGVMIEGEAKVGFETPSKKLEIFSQTLSDWGWPEQEHVLPWTLQSHVHPSQIDTAAGEMMLLPTFRLPTLIHTRSGNAKWLYEISHKNPIWIHPADAARIGVGTGDAIRVETEIGWFIDRVWVTEGIKPGILAMSHHLGRWRLQDGEGIGAGMSNLVELEGEGAGEHKLHVVQGGSAWESNDPDTSRIWWEDVGVHQNLTHAVHPDPISGAHCWHQKLLSVRKARPDEPHGSVGVDTRKSMAVYREWKALARSAARHSPDGTRRPYWLKRPLKPTRESYKIPENLLERGDE